MSQFEQRPRWAMNRSLDGPKRKPPRRWKDKFREAFRGVKLGIRGHSSFSVHFFMAAIVIMMAAALQCSPIEWCLLVLCIGGVFTAELVNSAIETLFHGLDADSKNRIQGCLDIAAGAVLMASLAATIIGCIILVPRFVQFAKIG